MDPIDSFAHFLYIKKQKSAYTIQTYQRDMSHFMMWLQGHEIYSLDNLQSVHIVAYLKELMSSPFLTATIRRKKAALKAFTEWCAWELQLSLTVSWPSLTAATAQESRNPIDNLRDKIIIALLTTTGLKIKDLIELSPTHLIHDKKQITVGIHTIKIGFELYQNLVDYCSTLPAQQERLFVYSTPSLKAHVRHLLKSRPASRALLSGNVELSEEIKARYKSYHPRR